MDLLRKIINTFYPNNMADSPVSIGCPIPNKFKRSLEKSFFSFIDFSLDTNMFNTGIIEKDKKNYVNLFITKRNKNNNDHIISFGQVSTFNDDFEIVLKIELKQTTLISFSIYVSKINGEDADLIFKFDNRKNADLSKSDLEKFVSHVINTLF